MIKVSAQIITFIVTQYPRGYEHLILLLSPPASFSVHIDTFCKFNFRRCSLIFHYHSLNFTNIFYPHTMYPYSNPPPPASDEACILTPLIMTTGKSGSFV
jgi:hypothetical protein